MIIPISCPTEILGLRCCLPFGHPGFHKTQGAMDIEATLTPEECEELEAERWSIRHEMDANA